MSRVLFVVVLVVLSATAAVAQSSGSPSSDYPRFEFFGGYSAIAPTNSRIQFDFEDAAVVDSLRTTDGYEVSAIGNIKKHVGMKADFSQYFRSFGGTLLAGQPSRFMLEPITFSSDLRSRHGMNTPDSIPLPTPFLDSSTSMLFTTSPLPNSLGRPYRTTLLQWRSAEGSTLGSALGSVCAARSTTLRRFISTTLPRATCART
jgi:hypothetical protein